MNNEFCGSLGVSRSGQVMCRVTGHEMPARLPVMQAHLLGKSFRAARARTTDFSKFLPHVVPSKKQPK